MSTDLNEPKASLAKVEANRRNAQLSTGPKDTNSTRYNAVKHGLLAEGVTELDNPEGFPDLCAQLRTEFKPVGEIETLLVRRIALFAVRLQRAALLEAEFITAKLNPPLTKTEGGVTAEAMLGRVVVLDSGLPARLTPAAVDILCSKFQRYETAVENKLYRALHELERLRRLRAGDQLPTPAGPAGVWVRLEEERNRHRVRVPNAGAPER